MVELNRELSFDAMSILKNWIWIESKPFLWIWIESWIQKSWIVISLPCCPYSSLCWNPLGFMKFTKVMNCVSIVKFQQHILLSVHTLWLMGNLYGRSQLAKKINVMIHDSASIQDVVLEKRPMSISISWNISQIHPGVVWVFLSFEDIPICLLNQPSAKSKMRK